MSAISVRIDDKLKKDAEKEFKQMGLSTSTAISLFFNCVRKTHSIPFKISNNDLVDDKDYDLGEEKWAEKTLKRWEKSDKKTYPLKELKKQL